MTRRGACRTNNPNNISKARSNTMRHGVITLQEANHRNLGFSTQVSSEKPVQKIPTDNSRMEYEIARTQGDQRHIRTHRSTHHSGNDMSRNNKLPTETFNATHHNRNIPNETTQTQDDPDVANLPCQHDAEILSSMRSFGRGGAGIRT